MLLITNGCNIHRHSIGTGRSRSSCVHHWQRVQVQPQLQDAMRAAMAFAKAEEDAMNNDIDTYGATAAAAAKAACLAGDGDAKEFASFGNATTSVSCSSPPALPPWSPSPADIEEGWRHQSSPSSGDDGDDGGGGGKPCNPWVGRRCLRFFHGVPTPGTIVAWLPEDIATKEPPYWKNRHDDGDEEDLEGFEAEEALSAFELQAQQKGIAARGPPSQQQQQKQQDEVAAARIKEREQLLQQQIEQMVQQGAIKRPQSRELKQKHKELLKLQKQQLREVCCC